MRSRAVKDSGTPARLAPEPFVGLGDFFWLAFASNLAVFDHNCAIAKLSDIIHRVGDENYGLLAM